MGPVEALVSVLLVAQLPDGSSERAPLSFQARASAVLVVVTPKGTASGVGSAVLLETAGAEIEASTDLRLRSMEQAGVDEAALRACPAEGQLGCWVSALGRVAHGDPRSAPRLLLVVSLYPVESGKHVLHSSLLDLERAERTLAQLHDQGGADWRERAEDAIYAEAVHAEPVRLAVLDADALRAYFRDRVRTDFEPLFRGGGYTGRLGRVLVEGTPPGLQVWLDDRLLGASRDGRTEITEVPVGPRQLRLDFEGKEVFRASAEIDSTQSARIEYIPPPPPSSAFREVAFWSATGLAALGTGLMVVAALQAQANVTTACVAGAGALVSLCPNAGLPTLGFSPSQAPNASFEALNPSGPSTAALGLGLLTAGSITALSVLLFGEDHEPPWPQVGVGLAAGLGAFFVVTALDPREASP